MTFRAVHAAFAVFAIVCGALPMLVPQPAAAQRKASNLIPEAASVTMQAKITALDPATRHVTLTGLNGATVTVKASPVVRLEMLKVGDTVNAHYYRSVAFVVSPPSAPVPENKMAAALARPVQEPGGAVASVTRLSVNVVGIDLAAHTIDVVNPKGGEVVSVTVTDPARQAFMSKIKVGDTLTAVVSETLAVAIDPATAAAAK
jgi:hypothetical protein